MRDVLAGRVPEVLQRELYALPALLGAALVVLADHLGVTSRVDHLGLGGRWSSRSGCVAVALDLNAPTRAAHRRRRRRPDGTRDRPRQSALPVSSSRRNPASSRMVSPSSRALSSLVPAFSPTTT